MMIRLPIMVNNHENNNNDKKDDKYNYDKYSKTALSIS